MCKFIGQSDLKHIMTSPIKTIASVLKASTDIITNISAQPVGLTEIWAIMSISTFKIAVILYRVIYFWSYYVPWHTHIKDDFWNNSPSHDKLVLCLLWGNFRLQGFVVRTPGMNAQAEPISHLLYFCWRQFGIWS